MSTTVEKLPGEPIAIIVHHPPYIPNDAILYAEQELAKILASMEGPLYVITDFRAIDVTFSDLVMSLADAVARSDEGSVKSERTRLVLVGSSQLVAMGASAFAQEQYGGFYVPFFASVEEALEYCRSN